ncbi:MAG TPA: hypothetical protein PKW90_26195, partial [Myxococcota bacterium]|nr:hypothetical protein [Myxococcota bacterium]
PYLFMMSKALGQMTKQAAHQMLRDVREELEKDAARHGGGWDPDSGAQAYAMTPKALGMSDGSRIGGRATFSDLVGQSMRPTFGGGVYGGWNAPSASGLVSAYRDVGNGGSGAVGWLPAGRGPAAAPSCGSAEQESRGHPAGP